MVPLQAAIQNLDYVSKPRQSRSNEEFARDSNQAPECILSGRS